MLISANHPRKSGDLVRDRPARGLFEDYFGHQIVYDEPAPTGAVLPSDFRLNETGLIFIERSGEGGLIETPKRICDPFEIRGMSTDISSDCWAPLIEWYDDRGVLKQLVVSADLLGPAQPTELVKALHGGGLWVSPVPRHESMLRAFFRGLRDDRYITSVRQAGWIRTNGGFGFVLPSGEVIGKNVPAVFPQADRGIAYQRGGTLSDWQASIGACIRGNTRLALAMGVAFSGPLLDVARAESMGFNINTRAQSGKSTALFAAASVWGRGARTDGAVPTWNATGNALEATAARASDGFLALDELSQVTNPRELQSVIYMLGNGAGKGRARRDGSARDVAKWRVSILSTGEKTVAETMALVGLKQSAGASVRMIEVPARAGGIYEHVPDQYGSSGEMVDALMRASSEFYGSAGRAFLKRLVEARSDDPDFLAEQIGSLIGTFCEEHAPDATDGQARSIARRFGLVYAALELARQYGVVPLDHGEPLALIGACIRDTFEERGGMDRQESHEAMRALKKCLREEAETRFKWYIDGRNVLREYPDKRVFGSQRGWVLYDKKLERPTYMLEGDELARITGLKAEEAAKLVQAAGHLGHAEDQRLTRRVSIPERGRVRVYCIRADFLND